MEGQTCGHRKSACRGRCAGRLDAREIIHMDTYPHQPASCPRRTTAAAGNSRARRRSHTRMAGTLEEEKGKRVRLPSLRKNCRQFLRRDNFKLRVGTIAGLLVRSPSAELRRMPEAISLHVVVCNFYN